MKAAVNSVMTTLPDESMPVIGYDEEVSTLIRTRYSVDDELAILRQRDAKPDEFAEYNGFCEDCKAQARARLGAAV